MRININTAKKEICKASRIVYAYQTLHGAVPDEVILGTERLARVDKFIVALAGESYDEFVCGDKRVLDIN